MDKHTIQVRVEFDIIDFHPDLPYPEDSFEYISNVPKRMDNMIDRVDIDVDLDDNHWFYKLSFLCMIELLKRYPHRRYSLNRVKVREIITRTRVSFDPNRIEEYTIYLGDKIC